MSLAPAYPDNDLVANVPARFDTMRRSQPATRHARDSWALTGDYGLFGDFVGTVAAPFDSVCLAKPRRIIRSMLNRRVVFDPATGTVVWSGSLALRINPALAFQLTTDLYGDSVTYDLANQIPIIWTGNPLWVRDSDNQRYLQLDGYSYGVVQNATLLWAQGGYTVAAWIKASLGSDQQTIFDAGGAGGIQWEIGTAGGIDYVQVVQPNATYAIAGMSIFDGWHHVAWVNDGANVSIYFDGVIVASGVTVPMTPVFSLPVIGRTLTGLMADLKVYIEPKTSGDILALFNKGRRG